MKHFISRVWYFTCRYLLIALPDNLFFQVTNWVTHQRLGFKFTFLNLSNPRTFNEKLNFLKTLPSPERHTVLADKVLVREVVANAIGKKYLVPCLGMYKNAAEIDFGQLPPKFILKTNHGSGWNMICNDKATFNKAKAIRLFNRWLSYNAYYLSRERQYKNIKPLIICEQLLEYDIYDYKFFCFDGKPEFVQVDIDRFTNHKRAFFNLKWEKLPFSIRYDVSEKDIPAPPQLAEMERIAVALSAGLTFSRIDLYTHDDHVYFGEITLVPGGGNEPFVPAAYDLIIGNLIRLTP